MKCLSLYQPWASLCVIGAKRFETRNWSTPYRGPLLIHAAKKWNREMFRGCCQEPFASVLFPRLIPEMEKYDTYLPLGCIIGMVELVECWRVEPSNSGKPYTSVTVLEGRGDAPTLTDNEREFGDYTWGRYAWQLAKPIRFAKPIPYRGMQGIFEVPDELITEIPF